MGLLEKTLKKAGKTRNPPAAARAADERPSVGWLDRSFTERTSALADKIDLEAQYARLEALSHEQVPPAPKSSLRQRALKMLSDFTATGVRAPAETPDAGDRPKRSLRERATQFMRRLGRGSSGSEGEGSTGSPSGSSSMPSASSGHDDQSLQDGFEHEEALHERTLFPWWALAGDGDAEQHAVFGDEPESLPAANPSTPQVVAAPVETPDARSPLEDFAETIGRITDNLKNLHVQLDAGNFIRDVQVEKTPAASPQAAATPLISHHVPVDASPVTSTAAEADLGGSAQSRTPQVITAPQKEAARDVFWPRDLPLDLPARDVRVNADGTVSVVPGPFQLPYLAEDIAAAHGNLSHFTRNLKNAELFIAEGELQLTRIIYERLLAKVADPEAKRKIKVNLDALDNYRKSHDWGSFMPIPPWLRNNPWGDARPPQVNVSEMPVEAKNITINLDKGFFEIVKAIFEQQKEFIQTLAKEKKDDASAEGHLEDENAGLDAAAEDSSESTDENEDKRRADRDRRIGEADSRGEGAPDRRSGKDRRAGDDSQFGEEAAAPEEPEEIAPLPPLAADGAAPVPDRAAPDKSADGQRTDEQYVGPDDEPLPDGVMEPPKIPDMSPDGQAMAPGGGGDDDSDEDKEEENKVQEIRGVLELKTPDQEDTPFLTLTYDFTKIPHAYRLAKDNGIFEYAYYKYKPMLVKAHQFIKRKQITRALNYYRVIREQQIPTEFRHMVDRNIKDITEYLQKYLVTRQN